MDSSYLPKSRSFSTLVLPNSSPVSRLGRGQLRAPKKKLRELQAGIHNLKIGRFTDRRRATDIRSLTGQMMYIKSICPADAIPLEAKLKQVLILRG